MIKKTGIAQCGCTSGYRRYADVEARCYLSLRYILQQHAKYLQAIFQLFRFSARQNSVQRRLHFLWIGNPAQKIDQFFAVGFARIHVLVR